MFSPFNSDSYFIFCIDEDSEPILGHWFEETLSSVNYLDKKDASPSSDTAENGDKDANVDSVSIIPEKGEPTGVCIFP